MYFKFPQFVAKMCNKFFLFLFYRNNLRRIAGHDEQQFSKDSIVNVMEKFVKSVNSMDETILVPCRLMDKQVIVVLYIYFFEILY